MDFLLAAGLIIRLLLLVPSAGMYIYIVTLMHSFPLQQRTMGAVVVVIVW